MEKPSKNHGTGVLVERYLLKKDPNFTEHSNDEMKVLLNSLIKGDKDSNAIKSCQNKLKKLSFKRRNMKMLLKPNLQEQDLVPQLLCMVLKKFAILCCKMMI